MVCTQATEFLKKAATVIVRQAKRGLSTVSRPRTAVVSGTMAHTGIKNATLVVTGEDGGRNTPCGKILFELLRDEKPVLFLSPAGLSWEGTVGHFSISLSKTDIARQDLYAEVATTLSECSISRVLCVPFTADDLRIAVAAADITGAPLALYFMDDLIAGYGTPLDSMLQEAIGKSRLCLAVTETIRASYQKRYGRRVWFFPPLGRERVLPATETSMNDDSELTGILLGDVANAEGLEELRKIVRNSGASFVWCRPSPDPLLHRAIELKQDGIILGRDFSEETLARAAAKAKVSVILAEPRSDSEDRFSAIKELSRFIYLLTAVALPIILIQAAESEVSLLLESFGLGSCVQPGQSLRGVIAELVAPDSRRTILERAKRFASVFSARNAANLIWDSLEKGMMVEGRFEKALQLLKGKLTPYVDFDAPVQIHWEFRPHYRALMRIKAIDYSPAFIFDVGASTGYWSSVAQQVFPESRFYCLDPLVARYLEKEGDIYRLHPEFRRISAAAGNQPGVASLWVSEDLYGSSLFDANAFPDGRSFTSITVPLRTLDEIAQTEKIEGRGILKIDAQFSEHRVLEGASDFLNQIDYIVAEVSLRPFTPEVMVVDEFVSFLKDRGFIYYDFAGDWRDPVTGELLQQDLIFARSKNSAE